MLTGCRKLDACESLSDRKGANLRILNGDLASVGKDHVIEPSSRALVMPVTVKEAGKVVCP